MTITITINPAMRIRVRGGSPIYIPGVGADSMRHRHGMATRKSSGAPFPSRNYESKHPPFVVGNKTITRQTSPKQHIKYKRTIKRKSNKRYHKPRYADKSEGIRPPIWPPYGPRMPPGWPPDGPRMAPGWSPDGPRMVPGWSPDGPRMTPG